MTNIRSAAMCFLFAITVSAIALAGTVLPEVSLEPAAAQGTPGPPGPPAIISNGAMQLGVNPEGNLGVPGGPPSPSSGTKVVGLRFLPTANEAISSGDTQESWGVADAVSGTHGHADESDFYFIGKANATAGEFTSTASTACSVVFVSANGAAPAPSFRVTHEFRPSPFSPKLYEALVTVENASMELAGDVRYRRVVDWDVEPTAFSELVTVGGDPIPEILFSSNDGFSDPNPLGARTGETTGFFSDSGPYDQGATFDLGFGALQPGEKKTFKLFYGAAANEAGARNALADVGADTYSLGKPDVPDATEPGSPNTFVLGFLVTNRPPTAGDDTAQTDEGEPVTFDVLANDTDLNSDALAVSGLDQPQNGAVDCTEDGQCAYTPNANFDGTDSFTYSATDGASESGPATVEITVKAQDNPPDTAITSGPTGLTNNSNPTFSWTGSDAETGTADLLFSHRLDPTGSWSAYSSATSVTLANVAAGGHIFHVRAKDGASNEDATPAERAFALDVTAPTVTAGAPAPGESGVPRNANVVVTFSEEMEPASVTNSTIILTRQGDATQIPATVHYDPASKKATLDPNPSENLPSNTVHTVTVRSGSTVVKDLAGNALSEDDAWSFTTADTVAPAPPTIDLDAASDTGVSATDNLTNDATPTLSGAAEANSTVKVKDGTALIGSATTSSAGSWSLTPTTALANEVHQLTATATDAAGNASSESATLVVTVDTTSPTVVSLAPPSGSNTISAATNVEAVFSEAMNASTISNTTLTLVRAGTTTPVSAIVAYTATTRKAVLNPSAALAAGAGHTATIKVGASDLAGNALAAEKAWAFAINSAPTIAIISPDSGATIMDRTPVMRATVKDVQTNLAKANARFFMDGVEKTNFTYDAATDRLSWTPNSKLSLSKHTAKVIARDPQGLSITKSWSFTVK